MRFGFADPPYLGQGAKLYGAHHPDAADFDDPATHRVIAARLVTDYPDGWVLCLSSVTLHAILPMFPDSVRVGAWCKSFASFKPGVNPAYCWEPVIFHTTRKRDRAENTVRDFLVEPIALQRGLTGAKPAKFNRWVLDLLGWQRGDTVDDLFPGTGGMGTVVDSLNGVEPDVGLFAYGDA